MYVEDVFEEFLLSRKILCLSAKSIQDYKDFLLPFMSQFKGTDLSYINSSVVTNYLSNIVSRDISKASKSTYIRSFKVFIHFIEENYDLDLNSNKIKVPKMPKRSVTIYSEDDINLLFDSVSTSIPWVTLRNIAILSLMYDSGLRQNEVSCLLRKNICFFDNRLVVLGKGNKERTVPMGTYTRKYLTLYLNYCPYESEYAFVNKSGQPLTCNAIKLFVSKLSKDLPFDFSSHKLRHNFATNYCLNQYDQFGQVDIYKLMYLMGHEDLSTTQRYLHFAYEIIAAREYCSQLDKIKSQPPIPQR